MKIHDKNGKFYKKLENGKKYGAGAREIEMTVTRQKMGQENEKQLEETWLELNLIKEFKNFGKN